MQSRFLMCEPHDWHDIWSFFNSVESHLLAERVGDEIAEKVMARDFACLPRNLQRELSIWIDGYKSGLAIIE